MKDKQKIKEKSKGNVLSFFEQRVHSTLESKDLFRTKSQIIGGVC